MSNATIPDYVPYATWRLTQIVNLLNDNTYDSPAPLIVAHEDIHDAIADCPTPEPLVTEEILYTPQVTTHALVHLKQHDAHTNEHFYEVLPLPTEQEYLEQALAAVFGGARSPLTIQEKQMVIAHTQNLHARVRAEVEAEERELAAQKQREVLLDEPASQPSTNVFPVFTGLKLKNADRAERDGYLLYVGNRAACVKAREACQGKGSVTANSKDGHSWKFTITLENLSSLSINTTFNFKKFASEAVKKFYQPSTSPTLPTLFDSADIEEIATY